MTPHNIIPWPTHTPVDVSAQLQASPWPPLGYEEFYSLQNAFPPIDLPDLYDELEQQLADRHEPSTFDRIVEALGSRDALLVYVGAVGGCFLTVGMAAVWSVL